MTENATPPYTGPPSQAGQGWSTPEAFVVRVAGLPWSAVRPLHNSAAAAWAESVIERRERLALRAAEISDTIQGVLLDHDDRTRRVLLSLRRDIYNLRLPSMGTSVDTALDRIDPAVRAEVAAWSAERTELGRLIEKGEELLAGELSVQRAHLRGLAEDPAIRHGLLLASPSLERYLPSYLQADPERPPKRARKIERALLEYVFRTACKTSPFSTLTTVALGRFEDRGGPALEAVGGGFTGQSHTRVNVAVLGRLADAVSEEWERLLDLPVEVSSGHSLDGDRIRYVRRTRLSGEAEDPVLFDSLREELFFITRSGLLREIISLVEANPGIRLGELHAALADRGGRDGQDLSSYLHALIRLSLLTLPVLTIDIHSEDPLRTFRDGIAGLDRPWADALAAHLDRAAELVNVYPGAGTDERRRLRDTLSTELSQAHAALNPDAAPLPEGVLYEDVSMPDLQVRADRDWWESTLLHDLRRLTSVLPLFDMLMPHRLTLLGFFRARYGEGGVCDDVLRFVHEFHMDIYDQYLQASARRTDFDENGEYVPLDNWLRMPEVDALNRARTEIIDRMRAANAAAEPEGELVLDDDFLDAVAEQLPAPMYPIESRSFFLQVGRRDNRFYGVVNRSYSGLTLLFSRFLHCFREGGDATVVQELREELRRACPDGAVFAELTGGYDTTNLNLHPPVTDYEIICPGEAGTRPDTESVSVEELQIRNDADHGLHLYCPRLERRVIPVYLGFLMPLALPEVQRALLLFSPTAMAPLDLWQGTDKPLGEASIGGHPRVRYRDLILARHTWKMTPGHIPRRATGQSDAEWFLQWQCWRRANGLPRQVFAAADTAVPGERKDTDGGARHPTKPQYVDFESYFSLQLLERMAAAAERRVVMTEMLPSPDEAWLEGPGGRYITEQTVEVTWTA